MAPEHRIGKQGRFADYLTRLDFIIPDEHGLSVEEERGLARQERLRQRYPPEEAEGATDE